METTFGRSVFALRWLGACCALFVGWAPVAAEEAGTPSQAAAAAPSDKLEVLVITAERRETNLQDTGVSASVLTSEDLIDKSVYGLTALQYATPSLTINDYGSANVMNIRGLGTSQVDIDLPSGVVIYFEGAPTISGYFNNEPWFDIASVEVLRGPQGTFIGRSASGGALFINSHDPELDKMSGSVSVGGGDFSAGEFTGVLNVPAGDTLAFRLSAHHYQRDDYHDHISGTYTGDPGDQNLNSVRFATLWKPDDALDVLFKVDYSHLEFGGNAVTSNGFNLFDVTNQDANFQYEDESVRGVLKVKYDISDGITLTSLTGAQHLETTNNLDANGSNPGLGVFNSAGDVNIYTQEFDLVSPDKERFRWVLGAFFLRQQIDVPSWQDHGFSFYGFGISTVKDFPALTSTWNQQQTDYAGFAHMGYDLTSSVAVEAGIRYSHNATTQSTFWLLGFGTTPPFIALTPDSETQQNIHESDIDGTVGINWTVNQDQFLYALISVGHTIGGVNLFPSGVPGDNFPDYDPMRVVNYEAGWKATWLDSQLRTQFDGYYETFDNYQANFAQQLPGGTALSSVAVFRNADGDSKVWGFELTGQAEFGNLSVDFGLAYLDSELGTFKNVVDPFLPPVPPAPAGSNVVDLSGAHSPFSPKWTGNVGVGYAIHLAGDLTLTPRVDYAYIDSTQAGLWNSPQLTLESRKLTNVQVRLENQKWWGQLWVTNATDEKYANAIQNIPPIYYAAPPRMYGLRVGMNF
jgi:iron complex outermembrane receptor protein